MNKSSFVFLFIQCYSHTRTWHTAECTARVLSPSSLCWSTCRTFRLMLQSEQQTGHMQVTCTRWSSERLRQRGKKYVQILRVQLQTQARIPFLNNCRSEENSDSDHTRWHICLKHSFKNRFFILCLVLNHEGFHSLFTKQDKTDIEKLIVAPFIEFRCHFFTWNMSVSLSWLYSTTTVWFLDSV